MTWVTDENGTRWVNVPQPKPRKSPRAVRFADIKVGDQLKEIVKYNFDDESRQAVLCYIVTDLWFDPVKGQKDHVAGEMVAVVRIMRDGTMCNHKEPHTKRGLASQGFHYADRDYIVERKALVEAITEGSVVGIGRGRMIRQRPKVPGRSL